MVLWTLCYYLLLLLRFFFLFFSHGGVEALWIYLLTYGVHRRACVFEDALHACLLFSEELLLGSDQI